MNEIDFIPSGYHQERRRDIWFRRRYMTIILVMLIWTVGTLVTGRFVSRAHAELDLLQNTYEKGLRRVDLADKLEAQLVELTHKQQVLDRLNSRTRVSAILSELTGRIGNRILLTNLKISQEPVQKDVSERQTGSTGTVKLRSASSTGKTAGVVPAQPMCFSVVLTGIAADAGQVAYLISRLEESDYFTRILPAFSRNKELNGREVTEFEVQCIVSDYVIEK